MEGKQMAQIYVKYNPYRLETIVKVNGRDVSTDSILYKVTKGKRLQEWIGKFPKMLREELNTLDFSLEYCGMELDWDDFKDALITEYKKQVVTENYVKDELTDSEIEKYYDDNIFGDIEARHILISPNTKDDMSDEEKEEAEKKAKKEAEDIIKKLDKGEKFADLAKEYSDDEGTASKGGKLTVTYGSVVDEFWEGCTELKDGEYSKEPVKSEYGYHIIYRIKQKEKPSLDKVKDDVIDDLTQEKISSDTTLQTKALVALRKKYDLDIADDELKKSYDDSVNTSLNATNSSN